MNICVIGGGGKKGKFGKDFCDLARLNGHNVYVLSHKDYNENDNNHAWVNFNNVENVISTFTNLVSTLSHIDIFIYNSNPEQRSPCTADDYKSTSTFIPMLWHNTINGHAVLPHLLAIEALKKMSSNSKLVFLVSGLATNFDRNFHTEFVGYATGKAAQVFLMLAFANHNDCGAISTAVSPHFDYNNVKNYENTFNSVYQYIMDVDPAQNGKIKKFHNFAQGNN